MKSIYLSFIFILLFLSTNFAQVITMTYDGTEREYRRFIPANYVAGTAIPMVINMHGIGSSALEQEFYTGFNFVGEDNDFIVIHPEGINNSWNSGGFNSGVDDVGFIAALIDHVNLSHTVDLNRVYACGMSNGGFMSYRLACELEDKIAAIASVTGLLSTPISTTCQSTRPMSVMQIHGTSDPTIDYNGVNGAYLSAEGSVDFWLQRNNSSDTPVVMEIPNTNTDDGCTATHFTYGTGDNGTEVDFYRINGGGHTWPNSTVDIGVTNRDFTASRVIWDFFSKHSLSGPVTTDTKELIQEASFQLSPNPSSDFTTLELSTAAKQVSVFNVQGQRVFHSLNKNNNLQIDTRSWATGLYLVEVLGENGARAVKKLVVE